MTPFDAPRKQAIWKAFLKQAFWKHWEKEKLLVMSNFSFTHSVLYQF